VCFLFGDKKGCSAKDLLEISARALHSKSAT